MFTFSLGYAHGGNLEQRRVLLVKGITLSVDA